MALRRNRTIYFRDWIQMVGRRRLAQEIGATKHAVDKWAQGKAIPETKHMRNIKRVTAGKVDYRHIIDNHPIENPPKLMS